MRWPNLFYGKLFLFWTQMELSNETVRPYRERTLRIWELYSITIIVRGKMNAVPHKLYSSQYHLSFKIIILVHLMNLILSRLLVKYL